MLLTKSTPEVAPAVNIRLAIQTFQFASALGLQPPLFCAVTGFSFSPPLVNQKRNIFIL